MKPAVFLDRDGVINYVVLRDGLPHPPSSADSLEFLPGVAEAIGMLRTAGFHVIVVTNQPDVATGVQQRQIVEAIHQKMLQAFPIDEAFMRSMASGMPPSGGMALGLDRLVMLMAGATSVHAVVAFTT